MVAFDNNQEVVSRVSNALILLIGRDKKLLEFNTHETTLAGRLMHYLIFLFQEYDVDMEYNRVKVDIKRWIGGKPFRPDIVIHKRGENNNLIAFEIKKTPCLKKNLEKDYDKLKYMTSEEEYSYHYGISIKFFCRKVDMKVFIEGKEKENISYEYTELEQQYSLIYNGLNKFYMI